MWLYEPYFLSVRRYVFDSDSHKGKPCSTGSYILGSLFPDAYLLCICHQHQLFFCQNVASTQKIQACYACCNNLARLYAEILVEGHELTLMGVRRVCRAVKLSAQVKVAALEVEQYIEREGWPAIPHPVMKVRQRPS